MQKFETKNRNKIGLIALTILLVFKLIILGLLVLNNNESLKSIMNYDDPFLGVHLINTSIIFIGFLIILIRYKIWKPKSIYINSEGIKFNNKQKETSILFSEISMIKINSSKIITSKGNFHIPFYQIKNLSDFLFLIKTNMNSKLSQKTLKQIDSILATKICDKQWKNELIPRLIFVILHIIVLCAIIEINKNQNFSFLALFIPIFSGILFFATAEIIRSFVISKKINFETLVYEDLNRKEIWSIYGLGILCWVFVILVSVLFIK